MSSSLLGKMAAAARQPYAETLTGFKWIGRVPDLAFGYEEALGYCVDPAHVRDKDGVSALLMVCDIAARAKADGRTLRDLLDDLARAHGLHATDQLSVRMDDLAAIPAVVDRLRDHPPASLGGLAVEQVDDLSLGSEQACRRPTGCVSGSPTRAGSSYAPRGRSPRSSATSRSSCRWSRGTAASMPRASLPWAASTPSGATCRRLRESRGLARGRPSPRTLSHGDEHPFSRSRPAMGGCPPTRQCPRRHHRGPESS